MPSDEDLLREALREAEAVLAHQLHAVDELDDKSEHLLALGVGAVGGALALFAFVATRSSTMLPLPFLVGWTSGFVLQLAALSSLLLAYIGGSEAPAVGPRLDWLAQKANDPTWSFTDHVVSVLTAYPSYFDSNRETMRLAAARRRWGLFLLIIGVALHAGTALYVLGRGSA